MSSTEAALEIVVVILPLADHADGMDLVEPVRGGQVSDRSTALFGTGPYDHWIRANEDRICECGHLWLVHDVPLWGRRSPCTYWSCKRSWFRRSRCRRFRGTGLMWDPKRMTTDDEGRLYLLEEGSPE
jgi:hypothetical protein